MSEGTVMRRESAQELRERLLRDEEVRRAIAMRAYEIYRGRGGEPGHEVEDWFQAEGEILRFLIQEESNRFEEDQRSSTSSEAASGGTASSSITTAGVSKAPPTFEVGITPEIAERADEPSARTAAERTGSSSELGVWSPTEPDSEQLAPAISPASRPEADTPPERRVESRAASETKAPRKRKSPVASNEASSNKPAQKRSASKKPLDAAPKTKRTRKPSIEG